MKGQKGQMNSSKKSTKGRGSQRSDSSTRKGQTKMNQKTISIPVSIGNVSTRNQPRLQQRGTEIVVEHREYLGTILKSELPFAVTKEYQINPSDVNWAPWASAIASRYESYIYESIELEFLTESPTSTPGYIAMAVDFNCDDPAPTSKQQLLQYQNVKCGPIWSNMRVQMDKKDLQKRKSYFCNNSIPIANPSEKQLYNTGNLFICVGGNETSSIAGDIFVRYRIRFMTPEYNALPGQAVMAGTGAQQAIGQPILNITDANIGDTATLGRPLSNYLRHNSSTSPQFTALKDTRLLIESAFSGTGLGGTLGTLSSISDLLLNDSGLSTVEPIENMVKIGKTAAMNSGVFSLKTGDRLDLSRFLLGTSDENGWDTLTQATVRLTPWGLH